MTSVTFSFDLMAERKASLACVRKPRNEFLAAAMVS